MSVLAFRSLADPSLLEVGRKFHTDCTRKVVGCVVAQDKKLHNVYIQECLNPGVSNRY